MKKGLPYILGGLLVIAVVLLFATGPSRKQRYFDERITLRKRDKIPYGTFVAYEHLKYMFPKATVTSSRQEPGFWDSLSVYQEQQAVVIVCPRFNADTYEMKNLVRFAENGNDVFISTMDVSYEVAQMMKCSVRSLGPWVFYTSSVHDDTLTVSLANPPFGPGSSLFRYPGKQYDGIFLKIDTNITTVLGYDATGSPDFIHLKAGKGNIYLHLAPLAFTNYFLLHKQNLPYYEKAMSVISPSTRKILWDEYYITRKAGKQDRDNSNWFSKLMRYPGLGAGLLTAMLALLVYTLMEMRRKQRHIPIVKKPKNESLDFVKIIGRLYHDKGDHYNLCRKMSAYFLEHVRNRYKLATSELNDEFVKSLHARTGVPEEEIQPIVSFIRHMDQAVSVSDGQLAAFHKQLESFYKKA